MKRAIFANRVIEEWDVEFLDPGGDFLEGVFGDSLLGGQIQASCDWNE